MTSLNIATITGASSSLTTATTAYTDGDQLGAIISLTMASAGGIIIAATLVDKANIVGAVDCFIYDRSVTLASDNAADAISDADALFKLGCISFPQPTTQTNNRTAHLDSIALPYKANATTVICAQLVTRSAHTFFGAATDLQLRLTYSQDV